MGEEGPLPAPDAGQSFREGLLLRLAEAEHHALREVERLGEALATLHVENEQLRSQLQTRLSSWDSNERREEKRNEHQRHICSLDPPEEEPEEKRCQLEKNVGIPDSVEKPQEYRSECGGSVASHEHNGEKIKPRHDVANFVMDKAYSKLSTIAPKFSRGPTVESVKRLMRSNSGGNLMHSPSARHYKQTGPAQRVARSHWFEYGSLLMVLLNALWISVDLDLNGRPVLESPLLFQVMEHFFVVVFSLELLVRFSAFKLKVNAFRDKWFLLDSFLVALMITESWVLTLVVLATDASSVSGLGVLSALRVLRLLRLARLTRLFRVLPELQTMIAGMLAGIRSVLITATILLAITYVFAIVLRQFGHATEWGEEKFSSVPMSIYTLLIESMLPDNGELLFQIGRDMWYCGVIYAIFLMLSAVTVMNLLVGIMCDVVGQVSSERKEKLNLDIMSEKLQAILKTIDSNYDGLVSKAEFDSILENDEAIKIFLDVGVDVQSLVEDSDFVFNQHGNEMAFEDFKEEVLMFRSTALATMRSLMYLRRFVRLNVGDRLLKLEEEVEKVQSGMAKSQRKDLLQERMVRDQEKLQPGPHTELITHSSPRGTAVRDAYSL